MRKKSILIPALALCAVWAGSPRPLAQAADSDDGIAKRVEAPKRAEAYYESKSGITRITVDAEVTVPDADAFPVVEAIPRRYTEEELHRLMEFFIQGEWKDVSDKEEKTDGEWHSVLSDGTEAFTADTEMTLTHSGDGRIEYWSLWGDKVYDDLDDFERFTYTHWELAESGSLCYGPVIEYSGGPYGQVWGYGALDPLEDETPSGCTISLQEARAIADEAVGILWPDYDVDVCGQTQLVEIDDRPAYYGFNYTKKVAGIPVTWTYLTPASDHYSYVPPQGCVGVVVKDGGICELYANTPWDTGEVLQEDSELLRFDEIMDIFANVGVLSKAALENNNPDLKRYEITVNSIVLGYMAVKTSGGYEFTPVWDFFGSHTLSGTGGYPQEGVTIGAEEHSNVILTLNAIDGTVIDRSYGY